MDVVRPPVRTGALTLVVANRIGPELCYLRAERSALVVPEVPSLYTVRCVPYIGQ